MSPAYRDILKEAPQGFIQWRARQRNVFRKKVFMLSLCKVTKGYQKAMSKVRTIVCCSKYYQNDFRY